MVEYVEISLSDLLLDVRNARLKEEQPSEQAAALAIAKHQKAHLLHIASDIVDNGLDPTALISVVPTDDQDKRYRVIEGNRRVVALKALETPALVSPVLNATEQKRLTKLAGRYRQNPISYVRCVLFESEREIDHWVKLRHTGQNDGVGLVQWGAEEQERYAQRHGERQVASTIIDFVNQHGTLSDEAKESNKRITTNLKRLLSTPKVRSRLGIEVSDGEVSSLYPASEVAKGLSRVIEDLGTGAIAVKDIYHSNDRVEYVSSIPEDELPNPNTLLASPISLDSVADNTETTASHTERPAAPPRPPKPRRRKQERTALIPKECRLDINPPRINDIYTELLNLSVEQYPNSCAVAFRVFVELSVDHYISEKQLMTDNELRNAALAKRIKIAADNLLSEGIINSQFRDAIYGVADRRGELAASLITFNQYVHNEFVHPRASELRTAWDELQPFIEHLWA
jgi:hypothetical protein